MCVCLCAFLAVIELLFGSVLKVGFYIMKWNVIYKCVCVCVCACVRARSCRCEYVHLGVVLVVQMGC